jgi:hypothetical protein
MQDAKAFEKRAGGRARKSGCNAVNQICRPSATRCGTRRNNNSDRHAMRIHCRAYFVVDPLFVRPIP